MNLTELNTILTETEKSTEPIESIPAGIAALTQALNQTTNDGWNTWNSTRQTAQGNNSSQVYNTPPTQQPILIALDAIKREIKNERVKQKLTQRDLAAKCGMSQGTITRAERHGWISINCLLRISASLGMKEIKLT